MNELSFLPKSFGSGRTPLPNGRGYIYQLDVYTTIRVEAFMYVEFKSRPTIPAGIEIRWEEEIEGERSTWKYKLYYPDSNDYANWAEALRDIDKLDLVPILRDIGASIFNYYRKEWEE